MSVPTDTPTSVYLYYDRRNFLIYVGITSRGMARNVEHNHSKEWWPHVARQEVLHFPTRAVALRREKALIQEHQPPFNKQHNANYEDMHQAYLDLESGMIRLAHATQILHETKGRLGLDFVSQIGDAAVILRTPGRHWKLARHLKVSKSPEITSYRKRAGVLRRSWIDAPYVYFEITGRYVPEIRGGYAFVTHESDHKFWVNKIMAVTPSSLPVAFGAFDPIVERPSEQDGSAA